MDIDVIGTAISQSAIDQPLYISALADVAKLVDAHIVGIIGTHRDQSMTHNLRNEVRLLETLARLGMKEYRAWRPIDAEGPTEIIRTEQYGRADPSFCKTVSARRGMIGDLAVQSITSIIAPSLSEADGARRVHWNAPKADHWTPPTEPMKTSE